jgi:hypothetical protein
VFRFVGLSPSKASAKLRLFFELTKYFVIFFTVYGLLRFYLFDIQRFVWVVKYSVGACCGGELSMFLY